MFRRLSHAPGVTRRTALGVGQAIIGAVAGIVLATPLVAVSPSVPVLLAGFILVGAMLPIYNVVSISYRLSLIPDPLQGRVNSVFRLLALGSVPLGTAIGGLLLGPIGPRAELWVIAAGFALCAVAVTFTAVRRA